MNDRQVGPKYEVVGPYKGTFGNTFWVVNKLTTWGPYTDMTWEYREPTGHYDTFGEAQRICDILNEKDLV